MVLAEKDWFSAVEREATLGMDICLGLENQLATEMELRA